jgi:ADP-heptose:LPS heptosyltransferase
MTRPKVLVARLDNNGDVLLAGPAVRAVARSASRVTLLCGPRGEAAARLLPGVDEVMVFRAPWIDPEPDPVRRSLIESLVEELAGRGFDQAVILTSFHQSPLPLALVLRMAGVRIIAGISVDYPGSLLDRRVQVPEDIHEVDRAVAVARALGYDLAPHDRGELRIKPASSAIPAVFGDYVVVHPGASAPARTWPVEHHRALVRALVHSGRRVVVTGSEAERGLTARVAGPSHPLITDLGGEQTLAGLADVIARADAIVVGNTGPAHLAAAVGTPVVSLFAPVVPAVRWRPWLVPHVLLGDQHAPCAGSRARTCPVEGHPCLSTVTVEGVLDALDQLAPLGRSEEARAMGAQA